MATYTTAGKNAGIVGEDVERLNDEGMKSALKKYDKMNFTSLIKQVQAEYDLAWLHQNSKIQENLSRLKMYNNQKRNKKLVGDPLLFGVHQTVLAALYDDQLTVSFEAEEEGDVDTADNLQNLAVYDSRVMKKNVLDYMWDWDTCFFARGLVMMHEFDRSPRHMAPVPEVLDPMTFLRDPLATSVNGDMWGRGSMRFGGREVMLSKQQMEDAKNYINLDQLKVGDSVKSLIEQSQQEKTDAFGLEQLFGNQGTALTANIGQNSSYHLLEWFTIWNGKKCKVVLGNNKKLIVQYMELSNTIMPWPIIDRTLFPTSHSWEAVSIPDLVEDKQRQRSVALNLGLDMMKADLYPNYIYNEKALKNPHDIKKLYQQNKMIATRGNVSDPSSVVVPINKASPNMQLVDFMFNTLDASAQRAAATPDMQQGQLSDTRRTLGELNLVASRVDKRFSLAAKIFGWSEAAFWTQWYRLYKKHFKSKIDEKVIRINGAFGAKWRPLTKENIIASVDPDIVIDSQVVSEAKKNQERILLSAFGSAVVVNDPTANYRYFQKRLARLNNMQKDEIDRLFPPTVDELMAEEENDKLNKDELPPISENDNHQVHWEIHSKAAETNAKDEHMRAHKEAMRIQRDQPELFPNAQQGSNPVAGTPGAQQNINPQELMQQMNQPPSQAATA